jgi:hypothetical protein
VTTDGLEAEIRDTAAQWAFIGLVSTEDKTDHALKMRLHIMPDCFIQVYTNLEKNLLSYAMVLNRTRVYGRDSEGGRWHRHPYAAPDDHDFSPDGMRAVSLTQFLLEVQQILQEEAIL